MSYYFVSVFINTLDSRNICWCRHKLDDSIKKFLTTDTPKPTASYGFGSAEEIREAAKIFQKAYAPQEKRDLPVTFADLRKKENKASEAH